MIPNLPGVFALLLLAFAPAPVTPEVLPAPAEDTEAARRQELAELEAELAHYPGHESCCGCRDFALAHRRWVDGRYEQERSGPQADAWRAWAAEAYELWDFWDDLSTATDPTHCVSVRTCAWHNAGDKRRGWGCEGYQTPPCVPVWRFREVR
jgi:hypothetical protein